MAPAQPQSASTDRSETPKHRARRVLSDRTAAWRTKLLTQLQNPVLFAEDADALTHQANDIYRAFKPRNGWQDWLTSEIAVLMVRINRGSRIERRLREYAAYRAIDFWEDDQALEVETLAARLDRDPARVVARLRQSPAGCAWLLRRWRALERVEPRSWTAEQRTLAGRLLGGDDANAIDPTRPGLASEQVADLEAEEERVAEADAIRRGLVEADLSDDIPDLTRLRRHARSLHRQLKWYIDQFHVEHPDRWDDPRRQPAFVAHELMDQQRDRPSSWSFAEPPRTNAETKPPTPAAPPKNSETKPLGRVELAAKLAEAVTQVEAEPPVANPVPPVRHDLVSDPKRRATPAQEVARRQKAARRRAALACSGGL